MSWGSFSFVAQAAAPPPVWMQFLPLVLIGAFEFTLLTVGSADNAIEQLIQADLRERGIRMEIRQLEMGAFLGEAPASRDAPGPAPRSRRAPS